MLDNLRKYHVFLASKSPRRRDLMMDLRIPFDVISLGGIPEEYPSDMEPERIPEYLSQIKAEAYFKRIKSNELIITADTLVICGDKVLGKPHNTDDAVEMLLELSDRTHKVVTGVTITTKEKRTSFSVVTDVKFTSITRDEVKYYVENFMPLDKAGAYGIQEWIGCIAVDRIEGSFYNVMGLPLHRLYQELKNF